MSRIEKFEDLIAWQKARVLSREIYKVTRTSKFSKDFSLVDQIRRASTSVMSNIAEGFERGGRSEFHQFLVVAKGSCAEVRSQLYSPFTFHLLTGFYFPPARSAAAVSLCPAAAAISPAVLPRSSFKPGSAPLASSVLTVCVLPYPAAHINAVRSWW